MVVRRVECDKQRVILLTYQKLVRYSESRARTPRAKKEEPTRFETIEGCSTKFKHSFQKSSMELPNKKV